jgi:hypothetical protein
MLWKWISKADKFNYISSTSHLLMNAAQVSLGVQSGKRHFSASSFDFFLVMRL